MQQLHIVVDSATPGLLKTGPGRAQMNDPLRLTAEGAVFVQVRIPQSPHANSPSVLDRRFQKMNGAWDVAWCRGVVLTSRTSWQPCRVRPAQPLCAAWQLASRASAL